MSMTRYDEEMREVKVDALCSSIVTEFMTIVPFSPEQLRVLTLEGRLSRMQRKRVGVVLRQIVRRKLHPLVSSFVGFTQEGEIVWTVDHLCVLLKDTSDFLRDAGHTPEAHAVADAAEFIAVNGGYLNERFNKKTAFTQREQKRRPVREFKAIPTVVCLCGSTRFYTTFQEANYRETMAGKIVLSVGFVAHAGSPVHGDGVGCTPEQKQQLDELHKRKIDMADEILVLNVDGYVGDSTRSEIEYAVQHDKRVRWWDEDKTPEKLLRAPWPAPNQPRAGEEQP